MKEAWINKRNILILAAVIIGVSWIKSVRAATPDYYVNAFIEWITSTYGVFFAALFGGYVTDEFLFTKILLFIIIFAVCFMAVKRIKVFSNNRAVIFVVALCVSILAVRYIKETDFIRAIILPYTALGGAITIFLPLLIYFFFVHTSEMGPFGRRAAWFIYAVVFFMLWGTSDYMGDANWIYYGGLGFVIVSLVFDPQIHKYFEIGRFNKIRKGIIDERLVDIADRIQKARNAGMDDAAERLERKYKRLLEKA